MAYRPGDVRGHPERLHADLFPGEEAVASSWIKSQRSFTTFLTSFKRPSQFSVATGHFANSGWAGPSDCIILSLYYEDRQLRDIVKEIRPSSFPPYNMANTGQGPHTHQMAGKGRKYD
jgi:hypothetical protein